MRNLPKKIELLANIAIIVVAILLGVVLVNRYLLPASPKAEAGGDTRIKPGMKLSLSGVDWSKADQTLLMVLSTNCHYCTESAPFYQRLAQQKAGRTDLRLVAVLPQVISEAQKYLNEHGVTVDEIGQAPPLSVSAKATPTLIMVDRTGSVVDSWVGKLPPEKETEVLQRFLTGHASN
jgi:hypothetical protein